jgi:hypothetical protein
MATTERGVQSGARPDYRTVADALGEGRGEKPGEGDARGLSRGAGANDGAAIGLAGANGETAGAGACALAMRHELTSAMPSATPAEKTFIRSSTC